MNKGIDLFLNEGKEECKNFREHICKTGKYV
jgi:hypothetical protein